MRTTEQYLEYIKTTRSDHGDYYDYSKVNYRGSSHKITIICPIHGEFEQWPGDHRGGIGCWHCGRARAKETNIQRYGVDNPIKDTKLMRQKMLEKYGVDNPGLMADHITKVKETNLKKFGVEWGATAPQVNLARIKTNIARYGFAVPIQNKGIAAKAIATKVANGGFNKSNSSLEATMYIRKYIKEKGYDISQCAYADSDLGLYEWGIYHNGKWVLYDLVVFEPGCRGDKTKIVEILEYHGPFHYTNEEANDAPDAMAYPWKSNKTTVMESYCRDIDKETLALSMTPQFTAVRTRNI